MPSDGRPDSVQCIMVGEHIPTTVCETEQGSTHCQGCTAQTRRCLKCGKACGIVDAVNGWCGVCAEKSDKDDPVADDKPDVTFASLLHRVRLVQASELDEELPTWSHKAEVAKPARSKASTDPAAIHLVLLEHGVKRGPDWVVSVPRSILIRRVRLLPEEADEAMKGLVKGKYLRGSAPWDEATLLKTDGIEEIKAKLDHPRAATSGSGTHTRHIRRKRGKTDSEQATKPAPTPPKPAPPPVAKPKPAAPTPVTQPKSPPPTPRPITSAKPLGTYAEAYASLVERSQMVGNQRILRSALPVLQIRWRIGPEYATQILEKLLRDGHISQNDGWRSIVLLKDAIVDETPLPSKETVRKPSSHTPHPPHGPRPRPPMPTPGSSAVTAAATQTDVALDPLDAAIQAIEAQLQALRALHEGVAQEMQTLEACLSALQRAKQRGSELSPSLREALTKAALANANLLAALSG